MTHLVPDNVPISELIHYFSCVYLMQCGAHCRIGSTKLLRPSRQGVTLGLAVRISEQYPEPQDLIYGWILAILPTQHRAIEYEKLAQRAFNITGLTFRPQYDYTAWRQASVDLAPAIACLTAHGLCINSPHIPALTQWTYSAIIQLALREPLPLASGKQFLSLGK